MSTWSVRLLSGTPAEVEEQLASTTPRQVVDELAACTDREVGALTADDTVRHALVSTVITHLPEIAVPEPLRALKAVIGFELTHSGQLVEDRTVVLDGGDVRENDEVGEWDAIIRTSVTHLLRIVTGQEHAGLLAIAGDLVVEGDGLLALDLAEVFSRPDLPGSPVDTRDLDPVEVAGAVRRSSDDNLRHLMAGSTRRVVLDEIFRRFPDFIDPRKGARLSSTIAFRLSGAEGEPDRYVVAFDGGRCTISEGDSPDRDVTISMDGADFLKLATGNLSTVRAGIQGRISVKGDRAAALALSRAIDVPRPR
ncbi:SCP2 sterol-binding domain-containing protein [Luteipulveratus halotolerans]|uniref:SCP2 domain-containing protein n=1 Tax=Luteipulveratus halotolerans TaxID=1631356 RepID=A0A0L6CHA9_9MICO|nr:SCP2 sterol-binding domain-containing protein [Luteipulveratus halotolerans]KNX37114.1 hypothetical protein VV01_08090 [Luteipulveratus halotolerans]